MATAVEHNHFAFKRSASPFFFQAPTTCSSKRFKFDHSYEEDETSWQKNATEIPFPVFNDIVPEGKRNAEPLFATCSAKRFKRDHPNESSARQEKTPFLLDQDGDCFMEGSDGTAETLSSFGEVLTEEEDAKKHALQSDGILMHILGFLDYTSVQRCRAVSKLWKDCCRQVTSGRTSTLALTNYVPTPPSLLFNAEFRVNRCQDIFWDEINRHSSYQPTSNIEISKWSWQGSMPRHLRETYIKRLIKLLTKNAQCNDGDYHDLMVLVDGSGVHLRLDGHTIAWGGSRELGLEAGDADDSNDDNETSCSTSMLLC